MATSLSGSCAQMLLRACIWWDASLWSQQSEGVQMCFDTQQLGVCIFRLAMWHPLLHGSCSWLKSCQHQNQQSMPTAVLSGPCLFCLTLARPCSCSVRFGMWSGARRLIAACHDEKVLLLDAPSREKPLTAEDMLLDGANLVSITATPWATVLWLLVL